jgi:hypothetical protein
MSIRYLFLTILLLAGVAPATFADPVSPLHNPINGLDVDDNARVQARDALIIINQLLRPNSEAAEPLVGTSTLLFPDTTDDGRVTPRDALLVINHLLNVPEPSSIILGGFGLCSLLIVVWRKRRSG